jgi:hypothetical protein
MRIGQKKGSEKYTSVFVKKEAKKPTCPHLLRASTPDFRSR